MKTFLALLAVGVLLTGCDERSEMDKRETEAQEKITAEAGRQTGMPNIVNFQEKKLVKRLYELRDRADLVTYTYIVDLNGHLHFLTRSVGFGIPYAAQFSNPQKPLHHESSSTTIPQSEPNGLYMPSQADGTWIMAVGKDGDTHPLYVEPRVIVSTVELPSVQ